MRAIPAATRDVIFGLVALVAVAVRPAAAQPHSTTIANLVIGEAVVIVKAVPGGRVYIGIGDSLHTSTLSAPPHAIDQFIGEASTLLRLGVERLPPEVIDRPLIAGADSGRELSLSRHLEKAKHAVHLSYHFFVADEHLAGYTVDATPGEAKSVLLALHRAARTAATPPDSTGSKIPDKGALTTAHW